MSKLLNGIYVTKDIAANRPTKLFNGHSGTKVQTASFANASGNEITELSARAKFLSDIWPRVVWGSFLRSRQY